MPVAALYDIHGNLPALEAVLAEIQGESIDEIVVGGDVYAGPMSGACHALLLSLDLPVRYIMGNTDREVLAMANGEETGGVPEPYRPAFRWEAQQLDPAHRKLIESWPATLRMDVVGLGEVLFCHATPRSDTEIITRLTPEQTLRPIFDAAHCPFIVCGHTHMQFDRTIGDFRVMNAGSVGMPFGDPGAYWLLLGPEVELRRTPYDYEQAVARIRESKYPDAENFASHNIAEPPSEQEMVELFTKAGLK